MKWLDVVHLGPASDVPVQSTRGGAVQRRIREIAAEQARRGRRVVVYSFAAQSESTQHAGVEYRNLRCLFPQRLRQLELQLAVVADLLRRRERVDVFHFHGMPEGALFARPLGALTLLTFDNFHFRGGNRSLLAPLVRRALLAFDALLACSDHCLAEAAGYWRLPAERLSVLYNGVDPVQFQPGLAGSAVERAALGAEGPVLLYVGRVCAQKGSDVLLQAARLLRARGVRFELAVAGPIGQFGQRGDPQRWEARLAEAGVRYLGAVEEDRLAAIYGMADLFVMPTTELEMFGMAAVEAQACGVPVVASDHGGLRETVPASSGARFKPGDAAGLAALLERLLADRAHLASLAAHARESAQRFTWATVCDELDRVIAAKQLDRARRGRAATEARS